MSARDSRLEQMRIECQSFHVRHPEVWKMFEQFTLERISKGFSNYSADAIFHRIRWELALPVYEKGKEFKLNNNHTAFYARRFMRLYPQHVGFFRTRLQTSRASTASPRLPLGPRDFDAAAATVAVQ